MDAYGDSVESVQDTRKAVPKPLNGDGHPEHHVMGRDGWGLWRPVTPVRVGWWMQMRHERACYAYGGHWWHVDWQAGELDPDGPLRFFCCGCGAKGNFKQFDGESSGWLDRVWNQRETR